MFAEFSVAMKQDKLYFKMNIKYFRVYRYIWHSLEYQRDHVACRLQYITVLSVGQKVPGAI